MEIPTPGTPQSLASRRDMLKFAATAGAGLALGAVAAKAAAPAPAQPAAGPTPPVNYKFKLSALKPQVENAGGSVALCHSENFPVVANRAAAVFLLTLKPGALREPHWHPNAWEFDYVATGTVEMIVVPPDGVATVFTLEPGDVAFVPQGFTHSIKNIGTGDAVIPIVFNNEMPDDIGLSTMYGAFPQEQFAQTFGVQTSAMAGIEQPKPGTLFIAPKV